MDDESDTCFVDTLESSTPAPDDQINHESLCSDINRWLCIFDQEREGARAKDILIRSFGLNGTDLMTLDELATKYHLSRERVRQIQQRSLRRLRAHISLSALA
jgi:DNA-directed RNA polymerase sigma subunit (sigma70/sigma32)